MSNKYIEIKGAREHNLKNIDVKIPIDKLTVITGLSGSGKSTLAFDTIYAEGQRRYVESLSAYARQFLGLMNKPDVDSIHGLSPAISIEQKTTHHNPRSTVGTVTEIYDYLRLLFARIGIPHCPNCGKEIKPQSAEDIVKIIRQNKAGALQILAPIARGRKGTYEEKFKELNQSGYGRVRVDGQIFDLSDWREIKLDKQKKHNLEVIIDRLAIPPSNSPLGKGGEHEEEIISRLTAAVEQAGELSGGLVMVLTPLSSPLAKGRSGEGY